MRTRMSRNQGKPRYKEIHEYLLGLIRNSKEMDKLPTENELSHQFGVSHITVRRALAELEKNSLIIRLPGRGTFIRNLSKSPGTLKYLLVLPPKRRADIGFFIPPIVSGIFSADLEEEFDIQTFSYNYDPSEIFKLCVDSNINGVIWIGPDLDHFRTIRELENFAYPVIAVNRIEGGVNYVSTDHEKSSEGMIDFLIKKGHKKIGFVGFCEDLSYIGQRYKGFLNAFQKARIEFDQKGLVSMKITKYRPFEFDILQFKSDFLNMLEKYKPSAIFVLGSGFIEITLDLIIEKGISIPDDLEIATFDRVPEKYQQKKYIHEIVQPLFELGKLAGEYLEKLIKGSTDKVAITLPGELILKTKGGE